MLSQSKKNRNKKVLASSLRVSPRDASSDSLLSLAPLPQGLALGAGASPTSLGGSKAEKLPPANIRSTSLAADSCSVSSNSTIPASPSSPSSLIPTSSNRTDYHDKLTEQLATLEIGLEFKLDLHAEDLELLGDLGAGNGGTVCKATHLPTKLIMARKVSFCFDLIFSTGIF
jgi:mitogen-activated protein kinase kinase